MEECFYLGDETIGLFRGYTNVTFISIPLKRTHAPIFSLQRLMGDDAMECSTTEAASVSPQSAALILKKEKKRKKKEKMEAAESHPVQEVRHYHHHHYDHLLNIIFLLISNEGRQLIMQFSQLLFDAMLHNVMIYRGLKVSIMQVF